MGIKTSIGGNGANQLSPGEIQAPPHHHLPTHLVGNNVALVASFYSIFDMYSAVIQNNAAEYPGSSKGATG